MKGKSVAYCDLLECIRDESHIQECDNLITSEPCECARWKIRLHNYYFHLILHRRKKKDF